MKLVEPFAVIDVIVTGLAAVEVIRGSLVRFVHYVEQIDPATGELVGVINSRIIMPLELLEEQRGVSDTAIAAHTRKKKAVAHAH